MNVEELLALSEQYITLSRENSLHDMYGAASANAAIAQAAAATAQAMVLAQMTENQPAASRWASAQAECHKRK